jgi:hypothetical protein
LDRPARSTGHSRPRGRLNETVRPVINTAPGEPPARIRRGGPDQTSAVPSAEHGVTRRDGVESSRRTRRRRTLVRPSIKRHRLNVRESVGARRSPKSHSRFDMYYSPMNLASLGATDIGVRSAPAVPPGSVPWQRPECPDRPGRALRDPASSAERPLLDAASVSRTLPLLRYLDRSRESGSRSATRDTISG